MKSWSIFAPAVCAQCEIVFVSGSNGPKLPVAVTHTVIRPKLTCPVPTEAHAGPGHDNGMDITEPPAADDAVHEMFVRSPSGVELASASTTS